MEEMPQEPMQPEGAEQPNAENQDDMIMEEIGSLIQKLSPDAQKQLLTGLTDLLGGAQQPEGPEAAPGGMSPEAGPDGVPVRMQTMEIPQDESNYGVSDTEVDDLLNKFDSDESSGPTITEDPAESPTDEIQTKPEAPIETKIKAEAPPELEYEFTHNGRPIKAALSKILKWAAQGYDYPQKMAEFTKQRESITALQEQYEPMDKWARENPDKWERVQTLIKAEQEGTVDLPPEIVQKLQKYDQFIENLEKKEAETRQQAEDQQLEQEITSIREKYKDLDWISADESGKTREQRVLMHAAENNFPTFKAAFLDLFHDDLLSVAQTKAKEELAANKERNAKQGLLATKQAPSGLKREASSSGKQYPKTEDILQELGIN